MALAGVLAEIQGLSSNPSDLSQLQNSLKKQDDLLRDNAPGILEACAHLDLQAHSLGALYLLEARARKAEANVADPNFLDAALALLRTCDPTQIRMAPDKFVSLCRHVRVHAILGHQPKRAIVPLKVAISKLLGPRELLTPIHADLYLLCAQSKCCGAAVPIIDSEFCSVDPEKTGLKATDVLLACYYGGLVQIGRKQYGPALDLLLTAITAPTLVVNAITVASVKKYMLVSLLHTGEVAPLPKYTSSSVMRSIKSDSGLYTELAKAMPRDDFAAFVVSKQQEFMADGNWGLVQLVLQSHAKRSVQQLTQTFLTLSLADVAQHLHLPSAAEAEQHVLRMIDAGEVFAEISERDSMVRFKDDPEAFDTQATADLVDSFIQRSIALSHKTSAINHMVSCDKAYLSKVEMKAQQARFEDTTEMA